MTELKRLTTLWGWIIRERDGFKCVVTGARGTIPKAHPHFDDLNQDSDTIFLHPRSGVEGSCTVAAHHIFGKSRLDLRFSLENGICLSENFHMAGLHSNDPRMQLVCVKMLRETCGERRWKALNDLAYGPPTPELPLEHYKAFVEETYTNTFGKEAPKWRGHKPKKRTRASAS